MDIHTDEDTIRRIVREELLALLRPPRVRKRVRSVRAPEGPADPEADRQLEDELRRRGLA